MKIIFPLSVFIFCSCVDQVSVLSVEPLEPPTGPLVWIGKVFSGGRQCTSDSYTPPDTKRLLNAARVGVACVRIEHYAVCNACGCPTYAAMHFALISQSQMGQAEALGFRRVTPPEGSRALLTTGSVVGARW